MLGHSSGHDEFGSTRWSVVLQAGQGSSVDARKAFAQLCEAYRAPVFAYVLRRVRDCEQAQDLTQSFFQHMLEKNTVSVADPGRGKFRAFLLTSLRNFLGHAWEKAKARKRGGDRQKISLDSSGRQGQRLADPQDNLTAERLFDQQWAKSLLDRSMAVLQGEYARSKRTELFEKLRPFIGGDSGQTYKEVAAELQISAGAAAAATTRLRQRFAALLRSEIAQTVSSPTDVDDEIKELFNSLSPANTRKKV